MNLKKSLSWKFLLPFGFIWLIIFNGSLFALIGTLVLIMGIIDALKRIIKTNFAIKIGKIIGNLIAGLIAFSYLFLIFLFFYFLAVSVHAIFGFIGLLVFLFILFH